MEKFIPFSSEFTFSHIWLTVPDAMLITLVVYIIVRLLWLRKMRLSRTILCGLFAVYLAALAALLLFPLYFSGCRFDWGGISAAFHPEHSVRVFMELLTLPAVRGAGAHDLAADPSAVDGICFPRHRAGD